ncbi:45966_t:CDS:2, partial [Gigaspora margarita]
EVHGLEFALAYLFIKITKEKSEHYKDYSEINAVQIAWPAAKIQLCLWHLKRA